MTKGMRSFAVSVVVAVFASGCSAVHTTRMDDTTATLRAIDIGDRELKGKEVLMTERREDGAWSVTYLQRDRLGHRDSRVVVTDWVNEQHYDVPTLQGIGLDQGGWNANGDFVFKYRSGASVTLEISGADGREPSLQLVENFRHGVTVASAASRIPNLAGMGSLPSH